MGGQDLNVKFTNEKYMTRMEVAKSLGTNLIDQIWREILNYRRNMSRELSFYDNAHFHFTLTSTPKVLSCIETLSTKVAKYISSFDNLIDGSIAKYTFTHDMLKIALKSIAKENHVDISEITLQNIIEHKGGDVNYLVIINYYKALERLAKIPFEEINEEFLATYYAILKGQEELTSFYRVNENQTPSSRYLVGAEYNNGVQVHLIEDMMSTVLEFAKDKDQPVLSRVVGVLFMFNYIKPFEEYNNELAILVVKSLLAQAGLGQAAVYVPIENILNDHLFYGEISREVQKSRDFTYAFLKGSEVVENSFSQVIDRIIQVNSSAIESTANLGDSVEEFKKEFGFEPKQRIIEEPKVEVPHVAPKPAPVPAPRAASIPEYKQTSDLSEKELKAREIDMLESNPYIKKGQAHFYVRHCTKGRYYTIQQYKKCEGCVYETARTSMDNLAKEGYYRREQLKNKFVYTPIDKE